MHHDLEQANVIIVLGSYDMTVPKRAIELYKKGYAPIILFSGAYGLYTEGVFKKTEAETFADLAVEDGVPEKDILIEDQSTNTGENIKFSKRLLEEKNIKVGKCILVTKPYMERRAYATFKQHWPELEPMVTSPTGDMNEYLAVTGFDKRQVVNTIIGDTQRIKLYPEKGYQIFQEIPANVWEAWERLVESGYSARLIA